LENKKIFEAITSKKNSLEILKLFQFKESEGFLILEKDSISLEEFKIKFALFEIEVLKSKYFTYETSPLLQNSKIF
jgi:hypothetical protein